MKDETADVAVAEFLGLKPKMVVFGSEHKKAKGVNKNVVAIIRQWIQRYFSE